MAWLADASPCDLPIVHVDNHLIVVDKPAGLLSVPGRGPEKADCALARTQQRWPDAIVVHRLDMATSGLLVMARGAVAQRRLSMAFEQHEVAKRYLAVVSGWLHDDAGEIDAPLMADWPRRPLQKVDPVHGRPSLTRYRVIERLADGPGEERRSRLVLEPVTGRSHQLRVHLAHIGHPIVGDALYAPGPETGGASRMLLHASGIDLPHPDGSGRRHFVADPSF